MTQAQYDEYIEEKQRQENLATAFSGADSDPSATSSVKKPKNTNTEGTSAETASETTAATKATTKATAKTTKKTTKKITKKKTKKTTKATTKTKK